MLSLVALGSHGYMTVGGGGSGDNLLERMRQVQDKVIQKATAETNEAMGGGDNGNSGLKEE